MHEEIKELVAEIIIAVQSGCRIRNHHYCNMNTSCGLELEFAACILSNTVYRIVITENRNFRECSIIYAAWVVCIIHAMQWL